ncbi:MAG: hypothetical protein K0S71_1886 [Clostridia bacterium]|jgi:hypothetical protein|nr:hypothetical protein [Clostridia bacterium]
MKFSKVSMVVFAFVCFWMFSGSLYASEFSTTDSNVKVEVVEKDDKNIEMIVSEDKYVRITQPTKVNTSTFESKMNIAGETSQGTEIVIEVYNIQADKDDISLLKASKVYELKTVGITKSFNQLIELLEGENKVVLTYTNEKDKKDKEEMIFYIIRESEKTKESVKKPDSVLKVFETIKGPMS